MSLPHPECCPGCGATAPHFRQDFTRSRIIGLARGNPTTLGQQAELNSKRVGKERLAEMAQEDAQRVKGVRFSGKLPPGAKHNTTATGETPWFRDGSIAGVPALEKPLDMSRIQSPADAQSYIETGVLRS
jgi:hypothetical protein